MLDGLEEVRDQHQWRWKFVVVVLPFGSQTIPHRRFSYLLSFYNITVKLNNKYTKKKKSSKYIIQCSAAMPMNIYPACKGPIPSHACPLNCLGNPLNEKNKIKHAIKNNKHD
jgi:hypothetical protein